ncbi:MAG: hypothetical protein JEZ14_02285 [Marinilabiliaceae bacterium]|nr:hypothetical protein [Marinilabiliaceae bacterium]
MKRRKLLMLLITLTATTLVYAEKQPIKFGKVSLEDLEMTTYEPDTSAAAVVLCKYAKFNGTDFKFYELERIKVLKKSGADYAVFTVWGGDDVTFRGKTYNLENGEMVVSKLKRESIFKERVYDDHYRYRIALPNVKEGSIFELEQTSVGLPSKFTFQRSIPVKWCELILEESIHIDYRKKMVGFEPLAISDGRRFVGKNMPAFKSEAFMSSRENYITKFEFDLQSVSFPGYYKSYTTTWEAVNKRLKDHSNFGGTLTNGAGYHSDLAKEIKARELPPLERAKAAFSAIKVMNWNGNINKYSSSVGLQSIYKDGSGNSTDINFMLLHLLKKLDIEAYPVVMSTRKNGLLNPFYPSYGKLNYTLVCAIIDEKEYLLDATEKELEFGMLPVRCLNQQGRLVNKEEGKWVEIKPNYKDRETIFYELKLDDQLNLEGKMNYSRTGYAAYDFRKDYKEYAGDEEYLTSIESEKPGLTIKNFAVENLDNLNEPLRDSYDIKIKNKVEQINDMILINPFLFEQITDNPFKLEERQYPVDFAYQRSKYLISNIIIPEGYMVSELPKPIVINLPDKSMSVKVQFQAQGNKLMSIYKYSIKKTLFMPDEYAYLKAIYEQIIKKQAEPIILKPTNDAASL